MADDAEQARQRAEARRQKILAKQKDRLSSITGVYAAATADATPATASSSAAASPPPSSVASAAPGVVATPQPSPAPSRPTPAPSSSAAADDMSAVHPAFNLEATQSQLEAAQAAMQQFEALLASSGAQQPSPSPQDLASDTGAVAAVGLRQRHRASAAGASTSGVNNCKLQGLATDLSLVDAPLTGSTTTTTRPNTTTTTTTSSSSSLEPVPAAAVRYSRAVSAAVRYTALLRLLSAALIAFAAVSGRLPGWAPLAGRVPPVAMLWLLDVLLIAAAAWLVGTLRPRSLLADPAAADATPWRLRQVNLLGLIPGLQEVSSVVVGYQQLVSAISADAAMFVVTAGLLLNSAQSRGLF